jgi:hypothetical protein
LTPDPVCTTLCYDVVSSVGAGTLPDDMAASLWRHQPPGYRLYRHRGSTGIGTFQTLLAQGNPVVVLEADDSSTLHWTVVLGTYASGSDDMVILANASLRSWSTFVNNWSFGNLDGGSVARGVLSDLGLDPYVYMYYQQTTELGSGEMLSPSPPGSPLFSFDGRFEFVFQSDGNLVLYDQNHAAIWASHTNGRGGVEAVMQTDGNLVIYDASHHALWATGTNGHNGAYLAVQNDGNVVLYDSTGMQNLWSTGTCCR